jgi:hypothetical protein
MEPIPETLATKRNQYEAAFILLVGDFLRVCEFIELTDTHLDFYSHRLYEILLRACTEFESLCREYSARIFACAPARTERSCDQDLPSTLHITTPGAQAGRST